MSPSSPGTCPPSRPGEPIFQFNGKDLTGFYTYLHDHQYDDPARGLHGPRRHDPHLGRWIRRHLTTKDEFHDYHLVTEWKWGERTWAPRKRNARDSGILVHCVGPDGAAGGNWMESQECQIIEGGCGDLLMVGGVGKPSLTCETRRRPGQAVLLREGRQTRHTQLGAVQLVGPRPDLERRSRLPRQPRRREAARRVEPDGSHLRRRLDHQHCQRLRRQHRHEIQPDQGQDHFQSEGAEIFFRKIEIRPLIKSPNG